MGDPVGVKSRVSELDLTMNRSLQLQYGEADAIVDIRSVGDGPVYQLYLAGPNHVYLSSGIWSHNKSGAAWPAPIPF